MKVTVGHQEIEIRPTWLDRAISHLDPVRGAKRLRARIFTAMVGSYVGASRTVRSLQSWNPRQGDADSDTIYDLQTLRDRSRDQVRNDPLATGAINTATTNIVGSGLRLQARPDREVLGWSDEEAAAWESQTEREFGLWGEGVECDLTRRLPFGDLQELAFRSTLESGDVFALLPMLNRPGSPYQLKVQLVEADRVSNPGWGIDTSARVQGVEKDSTTGAPVAYHIASVHPGSLLSGAKNEWTRVEAFGATTGRRNVIHLYRMLRPDQSRGIPYLAPVIEPLKQIGRYTSAELMAAVVSGMFTVFIKTELGEGDLAPMLPTSEIGGATTDEDYKLGHGAMIGLAPGEDIAQAKPERPNTAFDPFVQAILRQIGVALELPFEILIKHFTASYSAARAALLEAWKFFRARRYWLGVHFCQPIYEAWMWEAVAMGRIRAPGFVSDPLLRKAYLGAEWVGPARGMINELDETQAAQARIDLGISDRDREAAELVGVDWEQTHRQQVKEQRRREADGLRLDAAAPARPGATRGRRDDADPD